MPTQTTTALDDYFSYLAASGVEFDVCPELDRDPDQPGRPHPDPAPLTELRLEGLPPILEHRDPAQAVAACHATKSVARAMTRHALIRRGEPFWDVGSGTGVLAIAAALLGADPVVATDICPIALDLAARNAAAAGVELELSEASLLDRPVTRPVTGLVVANLPHKPHTADITLPLAQGGGPEGDSLWSTALDQAAACLDPRARLLFFLHSLPTPRLLARIGRDYRLTLLSWKRRFLEPGEYGVLQDWFLERHRAGTSYVGVTDDGRRFLMCGIWLAGQR